jgi:23S rRNA G2445 N2-methylase RlmL
MKLLAHTIKGLESICRDELIHKLDDIEVSATQTKKVFFNTSCFQTQMADLRSVDDLSLFVNEFEFNSSEEIIHNLQDIKWRKYLTRILRIRELDKTFSITLSSYKNGNIDKKDIKSKFADYFKTTFKREFTPRQHDNFDIRIQIEKNKCIVLIKLFPKPLFHRDYRLRSQKGAIRPTIAGAMLYYLTKGRKSLRIVDNFCGSGTFLSEALLEGHRVYGGDISKESIQIAAKNLKSVSKSGFKIRQLNAENTSWTPNTFDLALSNLPWDKQISTARITKLYSRSVLEYGRILKPKMRIGLIGIKKDLILKYVKEISPQSNRIESIPVGILGQNPTIVVSYPS